MNGQAPNQNGSTPGTPVPPGGKPSALLDDPTSSAIHDALQMGWSIIELKSRLQVAAMSNSISGPAQTGPAKGSVDSTGGPVDKILQDVLSAVENAKSQLLLPESAILQQQPADSLVSRQNMTDLPDNAWLTSLWRATFSRIAESHKRSFPGSSTANTYYDLPDPSNTPNYQALVASPQGYEASTMYLPYLYLHPAGGQDYGNIGIQSDSEIPTDFKLYDVARRAVNCLTLLYADPEESLIPVTVTEFQNQLVQNISNYSQFTATLGNAAQAQSDPTTSNQPGAPQEGEAPAGQSGTGSGAASQVAPSFEDQRNNAIQLVSNQATRYLETWDCYAREALYVSGGDAETNEMQLTAYEAGRAMASLSWGITTATVPIEDAMNQRGEDIHAHPELQKHLEGAWLSVFDERTITNIQHQVSALSTALDEAYYRVHTDVPRQDANDVAVQPNLDLPSQAIRTISESLDYWGRAVQLICTGDTQQQDGTSSNAPSTPTDNTTQPRLTPPQKDAQNQGGISSNGDTSASASASGTATIRPQTSAQDQSSTPTNAVTPRPAAIPAMTWETSSQLRLTLIQQAEVWQSLVSGHQSLRDFTTRFVTQRIWNDFAQELEQVTREGLLNPVEKQIRRYAIPIAAVGVGLLVIIGVVVLLLWHFPSLQQSLITAFVFIVGSVLGFFGTVASRVSAFLSPASNEQPTAPGSTSPALSISGLAGAALIDAFQNGYKQILIEFDYLNHNVSVTYPLVEYFILCSAEVARSNMANNAQPASSAQTNGRGPLPTSKSKESSNQGLASGITTNVDFLIKDAYDFLVHIVWTSQERADEIGRIARAAFGPIGAFVGAQITPSSTLNSASSTSKRSASASISRG